jgi:hypothetical protein
MNERIKELALKAYNNAGQGTPEALSSFMEVYSEKFAELIVRECMKVIDDSTPVYSSEDQQDNYCQGTLNGYQSALLEVKQHFGVKE